MTAYAELQVTSNFSFLRGGAHPEELVLRAAELGHRAIALTDRNTLAGVVRAHVAAKEVGIRFVVGARSGPPAARRNARPLAALLPDRPRRLWPPVAADLAGPAAHHQGPVHAVPGRRAGAMARARSWSPCRPDRPGRRLCGLSRDPARRSIQGLPRRPAPVSRRRPGPDRCARRAGRARQNPAARDQRRALPHARAAAAAGRADLHPRALHDR